MSCGGGRFGGQLFGRGGRRDLRRNFRSSGSIDDQRTGHFHILLLFRLIRRRTFRLDRHVVVTVNDDGNYNMILQ